MSKKKKIILVLALLAGITILASMVAYFILRGERPWTAFYLICCGGILALNFLFSIFLVYKNFK
ncbi:MAG: hypothetical protein M0P33_01180 [Massilibacteroides sp.]|nr:hypothetical protein [Massilibacteroides sp.]